MIKKFFKAVILGMRETIPSLAESLVELLMIFTIIFWLPILLWVVLRSLNANFDTETWLAFIILTSFVGTTIARFIVHCIEALRYQEKEHCSFHDAWEETKYQIDLDDDLY